MFTPCRPDSIYHVSVMMCYDKKLEASRSDFYNDIFRTRDVDCVITSGNFGEFRVYLKSGHLTN